MSVEWHSSPPPQSIIKRKAKIPKVFRWQFRRVVTNTSGQELRSQRNPKKWPLKVQHLHPRRQVSRIVNITLSWITVTSLWLIRITTTPSFPKIKTADLLPKSYQKNLESPSLTLKEKSPLHLKSKQTKWSPHLRFLATTITPKICETDKLWMDAAR